MVTNLLNGHNHESVGQGVLPGMLEKQGVLSSMLEEQSRTRPNDTAIIHGDRRLSFRELAMEARKLAAYLRHLGVAGDSCVGLFVDPSVDLMVGAWGILFAGGAYLPLSPEYPEERVRYMIEDSRTAIVFTEDKFVTKLRELAPPNTRIVTLRSAAEFAASNPDAVHLASGPRPEHLAYIIYTSGSTGRPKGVMIEHRSIASQMRWLASTYGLGAGRIVLQKTPMSFDAAQWEILAPACGAAVVAGSRGLYRDPERLIATILEHQVTTLQCVPTLLQALIDTEAMRGCTSLTQVFCGGEALSKTLSVRCLETLPGCDLVNLYGPTECTINSSAFRVDRETVHAGPAVISIGAPVRDTQYYILDPERRPVGPGELGELYIGGIQVARGYLHRPDLTAERFVHHGEGDQAVRLFRTGDLATLNADGTAMFAGRIDNQVKLRGYRVELDEIRLAIESHDWVKNAGVIVKNNPATGFQNLISFVELNPKEAALMDQGNHGRHHQSKESRLQVRAQLDNLGCRDAESLRGRPIVQLPGKLPTPQQSRRVFARKTYRFYEGSEAVTQDDLLQLLGRRPTTVCSRSPGELGMVEFGELLRYFGQYISAERLLPKYGYASPGSLYATQMYLELDKVAGLQPGLYYYHPLHHQLVLIRSAAGTEQSRFVVHFLGKRRAIEAVYKNNVQEVLEIEAGHMIGLFEEILPEYGLGIIDREFTPHVKDALECANEDHYLGTFEIVPSAMGGIEDAYSLYVQPHPGRIAGMPAGQYEYRDGALEKISDELVLKKHVIAINQRVYARASFGITAIARTATSSRSYVDLGRILQRMQMNDLKLGFMSSGYSSKSGNDLRSAERITSILQSCGRDSGPSYFFLGGRVSDEQIASEGMKEDTVHMQGPAEIIREDLADILPDYMMPNRVVVLDRMPCTANGKIDLKALAAIDIGSRSADQPFVAPRTATERRIGELWRQQMRRDSVSVHDDFFESGGNSLIAVGLINKINRELGCSLPLQLVFEARTVEQLARHVDGGRVGASSRIVPLRPEGSQRPIFCWSGLGGFTMNLRTLAGSLGFDRPFYGVQAHGINTGEVPLPDIESMAAEDISAIRRVQPVGPYALWGYSFGARVAFETARQLEHAGEQVEHLFLIAPGSPAVSTSDGSTRDDEPSYRNEAYMTILYSVFGGNIAGSALQQCLQVAKDDDSFAEFIASQYPSLNIELIKQIVRIVETTYRFSYTRAQLAAARIAAPVAVFPAQGDERSLFEGVTDYAVRRPAVITLDTDHYSILKPSGVASLVSALQRAIGQARKDGTMPQARIMHRSVPHSDLQSSIGQ